MDELNPQMNSGQSKSKQELTPTEVFLNRLVFWLVGLLIFAASFCLPFLMPLIFKFLRFSGARNESLIKFAVAGVSAFLLCLLTFFGFMMYLANTPNPNR